VDIGTAIRVTRTAVLNALLGRRDAGAYDLEGPGILARAGLTILAFAATTIIWVSARTHGLLGTASLYFPATLFVTLFAGWEFGAAILAASALMIWTVAHLQFPATTLGIFCAGGVLQLLLAGFVRELLRNAWRAEQELRVVAERRAREAEARELVLGEARHRLKNLMAIIEALAKFSGPRAGQNPAVDAYVKRFVGRLRALGSTSDLVLRNGFDVLEANAVVHAVLEPFMSGSPPRVSFDGPDVRLSERFGGALALAVHELASNALKYGALSGPAGTVDFRWTVTPRDGGEHVEFVWMEDGGPPPAKPDHDGFGHRLIRSTALGEPDGEVQIDYLPQGLVCRIAYIRRPSPPG
jgi:two-component sensor histidine kinase